MSVERASHEGSEIFSIGHSTRSVAELLSILKRNSIGAIADVRTSPFSRHFPHFNRREIQAELRQVSIKYVFLGKELGGRPSDPSLFSNGVADYEKMAQTDLFASGLQRVLEGSRKYKVAMMCSEHDPLDCHRCLLVGRVLHQCGISVRHIVSMTRIVDQREIEAILLRLSRKEGDDFFQSDQDRLELAYRERARKIAFAERKELPCLPDMAGSTDAI